MKFMAKFDPTKHKAEETKPTRTRRPSRIVRSPRVQPNLSNYNYRKPKSERNRRCFIWTWTFKFINRSRGFDFTLRRSSRKVDSVLRRAKFANAMVEGACKKMEFDLGRLE